MGKKGNVNEQINGLERKVMENGGHYQNGNRGAHGSAIKRLPTCDKTVVPVLA